MAYASTDQVWVGWADATAATTNVVTNYAHGDTFWFAWNEQVELTAEQKAARRVAEAAHEARLQAELHALVAIKSRAEKLLQACLTTEQQGQLHAHGWFELRTPSGRHYRIRRGRAGNVIELDRATGRPLCSYCCHPIDLVPDEDTMLAQKLMLEHQEDDFLRLANRRAA